jgi:hypothetical protein
MALLPWRIGVYHAVAGYPAESGSYQHCSAVGQEKSMKPEKLVFVTSVCCPEATHRLIDILDESGLVVIPDVPPMVEDSLQPPAMLQHTAAALVVAYGQSVGELSWQAREASAAGRLIPVRLEGNGSSPIASLREFDLSAWNGGPNPELDRLVTAIQRLIREGAPASHGEGGLENDWLIRRSGHEIAEMSELATEMLNIGELLIGDHTQGAAIAQVLTEISKTYRVVDAAIGDFLSAGAAWRRGNTKEFERLAHFDLEEDIHNRRGSCGQVEALYLRAHGLRAALLPRTTPEALVEIDRVFAQLSSADKDFFAAMESLGRALTDEARAIDNLQFSHQDEAANTRVISSRNQIEALRTEVGVARRKLQKIQAGLGYAEAAPQEGMTVAIHHKTIAVEINGNVHQSPIIVGEQIKNVDIAIRESTVDPVMKAVLNDLNAAVLELATHLPGAEAELAVRDAADIVKEATSGAPRGPVWRRAVDGLLDIAKRVADAGNPVLDLVGKISGMLGGTQLS